MRDRLQRFSQELRSIFVIACFSRKSRIPTVPTSKLFLESVCITIFVIGCGITAAFGATLRWDEVAWADGYVIYSAPEACKPFVPAMTNFPSATWFRVPTNQTAFYFVQPYAFDSNVYRASFSWKPSPDQRTTNHCLSWGTSSSNYTHRVDCGTNTVWSVGELQYGVTNYFAVKATGTAPDSPWSNEAVIYRPEIKPTWIKPRISR